MKLVTKVIAHRLNVILPEIINSKQSAFIKGLLIIDNTLISLECFHKMKKKTKGMRCVMDIKLDMSKAYDKVE